MGWRDMLLLAHPTEIPINTQSESAAVGMEGII